MEWIDVKNELPTSAGEYLVFIDYPHYNGSRLDRIMAQKIVSYYPERDGWVSYWNSWACDFITHWQPLPPDPVAEQAQ